MPWLIVPILLIGGAYLSFEGAEKVYEWFVPHETKEIAAKESANPQEIVQREAGKIKAAVRTDFILSIEIVVIALETVIDQALPIQLMVVSFIALLATVGVYGLVALLVRMDDTGFYLIERAASMEGPGARSMRFSGEFLVASLPRVIRLLSVIGTVAMLLVGGGMFVHNIEVVHHAFAIMPSLAADLVVGLIVGAVLLVVMHVAEATRSAVS